MPATMSWKDKQAEAAKAPSTGTYKQLKDGETYTFVVKDPGKVDKNNNGEDRISINPAVESGEMAGVRVFVNFNVGSSDSQILSIIFDQFKALGLGTEFFDKEPSLEQVAQSLNGRRFMATVKLNPDKNDEKKIHTNLRNLKPATGAPVGGGSGGPGNYNPTAAVTNGPPAAPQGAPQPQQWASQPQAQAQPQYAQQPAQQAQPEQQGGYPDPWATPQPQAPQQEQTYAQAPQPQAPAPAYVTPQPNQGFPTPPPI